MRLGSTCAELLLAATAMFALAGVAEAGPDRRQCADSGSRSSAPRVVASAAGDPDRPAPDSDDTACGLVAAERADVAPHAVRGAADATTDPSGPQAVAPAPLHGPGSDRISALEPTPAGPDPVVPVIAAFAVAAVAASGAAATAHASAARSRVGRHRAPHQVLPFPRPRQCSPEPYCSVGAL